MPRSFVHLHCHSHYSLLDGASPIEALIDRAHELGMTALALTDHGNLHGALEFYQKAKAKGINPIVGYEAYIAPGSRFSKEVDATGEASFHLTLLAQNQAGFKNLLKLASSAFLEGFYRKPRIDKELLAAHSEGLVCLSGCVSGEFSRTILRGGDPELNLQESMKIAAWFHSIFGNRYFIEIQNNGLEIQRVALEGAVDVAQRMGIPLVATSDAHYVRREDAVTQDVLLCINTGKFRTDVNRMRMEGDQFYLRGPEEMYAAFPGLEDAVQRSQEIADGVNIELALKKRHFPTFTLPPEKTADDYLRELCLEGLHIRYQGKSEYWDGDRLNERVMQRLDRELGVINKLGFPNYFLIVWDFVRFAKERGIPATARGSGVGALVSFSLGLSHVCPLRYDLLFERFLDESRIEAPDIDIDFCKERRGEVIDYVKQKYGAANVAQIGTFGTLAAKAAIRDVGRALGWPIPRVDSIVAMVPEQLNIELAEAIEKSDDLRRAMQAEPEVRELLELAQKIEGLARNVGTHAAAVVIADQPLVEYVPLQRVKDKEDVITQWSMGDVETAGLLKMDFLGLKNLTILSRAVELIEQTHGKRVDPHEFPLDDEKTFALLCRGETKGIFQLESGGIRDLLQRMKPDHFRDIIATNALYRPGPLEGGMVDDYIEVKHGRQEAEYKHPVMREILAETHGVMVYQEQVMRILNRLGDIELSKAYTCIKAISKKKLETIAQFREQFVAGAHSKGLTKQEAQELFSMIEKFAGYGFNKSHSTAYALIAYMTAYLKAHYPVEFMAALLSGDIPGRNFKKKDSLVEHLEDCRRMNIEVVPPDVNRSLADFSVSKGRIIFGLSAIKGVGSAAGPIVKQRQDRGPYRDLFDFCERVDPSVANRTVLESLIKAGAVDHCGGGSGASGANGQNGHAPAPTAHRAALVAAVDKALQSATAVHADRRSGQKGLFDDFDEPTAAPPPVQLPTVPPWDDREQMAAEKEVLGFYLSRHPLEEHLETLKTYCSHNTVDAAALANRTPVTIGGIISSIKPMTRKIARPGEPTKYAMFDLEDMQGILRTICWPDTYANCGTAVAADAVVFIRGVIEKRPGGNEANLIVNEVIPIGELAGRFTKGVMIRVDEKRHGSAGLDRLKEILRGYPGNCELEMELVLADQTRVRLKCGGMKLDPDPQMRSRVEELLGADAVKLIAAPPPPTAGGRNGNDRGPRGNWNRNQA